MILFICPHCGKISENENHDDIIARRIFCSCGHEVLMEHSYPILAAQDFVLTAGNLYDSCKFTDKENRANILKVLEHDGFNIDNSELDKYINIYEKIKEKYHDNSRKYFLDINDSFEQQSLRQNLALELIDEIYSLLAVYDRNKLRKPFVIIVASLLEQLFNDYFTQLVNSKLDTLGSKVFLEKYDRVGVQKCIEIVNAFTEIEFKTKMDTYSSGFFDKWASLRTLRNDIIHSNSCYISKMRISSLKKLIDESIKVFSRLKSELYSNTYINETEKGSLK